MLTRLLRTTFLLGVLVVVIHNWTIVWEGKWLRVVSENENFIVLYCLIQSFSVLHIHVYTICNKGGEELVGVLEFYFLKNFTIYEIDFICGLESDNVSCEIIEWKLQFIIKSC